MTKNLLVVHGGAPTAVMNSSLYGVIRESENYQLGHVYAAIGGFDGILKEDFLDLRTLSPSQVELLLTTPASAIGTSRDIISGEQYTMAAKILNKHDISYVLYNGGNGSMDACNKLYKACATGGYPVNVVGIPKTIDNDIAVTDHSPGYGSAALYIAGTISEISQDLKALPIHVCVVEAMGRNCGWIAAASALARTDSDDGPDLIYFPEVPFDEEDFLKDVKEIFSRKGKVLVVASEGLKDSNGKPIVEPVFTVGRSVYYGDVSAHLANLVIKRLGIKARSEKPGLAGRTSIKWQSGIDRDEAILVGREAVKAVLNGENGVMIGLERIANKKFGVKPIHIPIEKVAITERVLPLDFIAENGHDVTKEFLEWARPLVGDWVPEYVCLHK